MKYLKVAIWILSLLAILTTATASGCVIWFDDKPIKVLVFKNVTIEPTEGSFPLTITVTGEIYNNETETITEGFIQMLKDDWMVIDTEDLTQVEPNQTVPFSLSHTFYKKGVYDITLEVYIIEKINGSCDVAFYLSDVYGPIEITVLEELDEDKDGWDDYVEQLIHKYYPEFDPVNETPTKDDVVQAIINAVKQYKTTPDLEQKMQIREDVRAIIKEYREELRKG